MDPASKGKGNDKDGTLPPKDIRLVDEQPAGGSNDSSGDSDAPPPLTRQDIPEIVSAVVAAAFPKNKGPPSQLPVSLPVSQQPPTGVGESVAANASYSQLLFVRTGLMGALNNRTSRRRVQYVSPQTRSDCCFSTKNSGHVGALENGGAEVIKRRSWFRRQSIPVCKLGSEVPLRVRPQ